jgi:hypothetical protein
MGEFGIIKTMESVLEEKLKYDLELTTSDSDKNFP